MEYATCPNCGNKIPISRFLPSKVSCKKCKMEFGVEYSPEEFGICGKAKIKWNQFALTHPTIVKTIKIAAGVVAVAGIGYIVYQHHNNEDSISDSEEIDESPSSSLPEEVTDSDVSIDDTESDCDDESCSLIGCCRNCGTPLYEGSYTMPWEDGDNEYGYWTCAYCHAQNIDWDSGDD